MTKDRHSRDVFSAHENATISPIRISKICPNRGKNVKLKVFEVLLEITTFKYLFPCSLHKSQIILSYILSFKVWCVQSVSHIPTFPGEKNGKFLQSTTSVLGKP